MKKVLILSGVNFAILSIVIIPLLIFIVVTVLSIADIYQSLGEDLPSLTRSVVSISNMLASNWFIFLPLLGLAMVTVSGVGGYVLARYDTIKVIIIESIVSFLFTITLLLIAFITIYIPISQLPAVIS